MASEILIPQEKYNEIEKQICEINKCTEAMKEIGINKDFGDYVSWFNKLSIVSFIVLLVSIPACFGIAVLMMPCMIATVLIFVISLFTLIKKSGSKPLGIASCVLLIATPLSFPFAMGSIPLIFVAIIASHILLLLGVNIKIGMIMSKAMEKLN